MSLSKALAAVQSNPTRALELALAEWQTTRHPGLATVVERLGQRQARALEDLPLKQAERAAVLARAASTSTAANRTAVLAAFADFAAAAQGSKVWPSVESWLTVEPDPRVARVALTLVSKPGATRDLTGKLWRRLMNCVERHGDLGLEADLTAYESRLSKEHTGWRSSAPRVGNVLKNLKKSHAPKPVDEKALSALQAAVPTQEHSGPVSVQTPDALLAAVVATPDDDAPRAVLADWLTERGDVAGEFIALQLEQKPTKATRKREAELLAQHRQHLLGPLFGVVKLSGLRFSRGFVARCALSTELPVLPVTALLEDVDFEHRGLAKRAQLPSLEVARGLTGALFVELAARCPRLMRAELVDDLGTSFRRAPAVQWAEWQRTLASVKRPLRELSWSLRCKPDEVAERVRALLSLPLAAKLERLELRESLSTITFGRPLLKAAPATLQTLEVSNVYPDITCTFTRGDDGWALDAAFGKSTGIGVHIYEGLTASLATFRAQPLERATFTMARRGDASRLGLLRDAVKQAGAFAKKVDVRLATA